MFSNMSDASDVVAALANTNGRPVRLRRLMYGIVQGVGFRPTVANCAAGFAITGFVGNDDAGVFIEAQGQAPEVAAFFAYLDAHLPPLAKVDATACDEVAAVADESTFSIVASGRSAGAVTLIPPDVAPCADCLREMTDPADRRYGYPFISCTNCGPRLSIIVDVPYDRPLTTMAGFPMCPACAAEYTDPSNRRYHAQPISCFDCGPTLWLEAAGQPVDPPALDGDARRAAWAATIAATQSLLDDGAIIAVKGIGGFTLFCDARNEAAVGRLRSRKHRPDKPFATMCADLASARQVGQFDEAAAAAVTGGQRPIVLVPQTGSYDLAEGVAPGLDRIGIMLGSAPLHELLVPAGACYVATSGNLSGEPLAAKNDDARARLSGIVDYFLMHDRPVHVSVEDSVVMAGPSGVKPIRRSRGFAPLPVRLDGAPAAVSVLAVGAEMKNTFALVRDGMAFCSPHLGDMEALASQLAFRSSVDQLMGMHRRAPDVVVADKHPGYATSAWAGDYADRVGAQLLLVQHHHAHALSLLAERGAIGSTALVATLDGTGFGDDATIWGGELLAIGADPLDYERVWHLPGFWLAGGDSAVRRPWKLAAGLLAACGVDGQLLPSDVAGSPAERALVESQLVSHAGCVWTTSAGRVFDAVASMLGLCQEQTYEGQAGSELEATARACPHPGHTWEPTADQIGSATSLPELVRLMADGYRGRRPVPCLAAAFHRGLAAIIAAAINTAAERRHPDLVGVSGGVAQNALFCDALRHQVFADSGLVEHAIVPANDGGLSLGQAVAGCASLAPWQRRKP